MYAIYKFLSLLIYPFILILASIRVKKNKEDPHRYQEKLGIYKIKRPKGKLIWFHAASIGEFNAILPIIKSVAEIYPQFNILVTTVTLTAAKIASNNLPPLAIHQFAPFDCANIANKFINYWQPNLVIWTESEFWPNLLKYASARSKVLLINARFSEKSFKRWQYFKALAKEVLSCFSLILTQNQESKDFIEYFDIKNVIYSGNLKFLAVNFNYKEEDYFNLKQQLLNRIVVMAASTHPGEEEIFAKIHANLKKLHPPLLTIIAPRHPHRKEAIIDIIKQNNLNYVIRSNQQEITKNTDVLLVDTLGEFGLFYNLTEIVCMGGSWCKISHNFIEPAKLGKLIIFGNKMDNSKEVANYFIEKKAAIQAIDIEEIQKIIENYLIAPEEFYDIKENATETVKEMEQVRDIVLKHIEEYFKALN